MTPPPGAPPPVRWPWRGLPPGAPDVLPIPGTTRVAYLEEDLAALDVTLTPSTREGATA